LAVKEKESQQNEEGDRVAEKRLEGKSEWKGERKGMAQFWSGGEIARGGGKKNPLGTFPRKIVGGLERKGNNGILRIREPG